MLATDQRSGIGQLLLNTVLNPLSPLKSRVSLFWAPTWKAALQREWRSPPRVNSVIHKGGGILFEFQRRITSVVVHTPEEKDRIITKGAPKANFPQCVSFELAGQLFPMHHAHIDDVKQESSRDDRCLLTS